MISETAAIYFLIGLLISTLYTNVIFWSSSQISRWWSSKQIEKDNLREAVLAGIIRPKLLIPTDIEGINTEDPDPICDGQAIFSSVENGWARVYQDPEERMVEYRWLFWIRMKKEWVWQSPFKELHHTELHSSLSYIDRLWLRSMVRSEAMYAVRIEGREEEWKRNLFRVARFLNVITLGLIIVAIVAIWSGAS